METTSKQLLYDFELTNQSNQEVMEIMNSCFDLLQMKFKNTEFMKFMFYRLQDTIHEFDKIMYESSVGLVEDNLVRKLKPSIFVDKEIVEYVDLHLDYVYQFHFTLYEKYDFHVNIICKYDEPCNIVAMINQIILLMVFCLKQYKESNDKQRQRFVIDLYMTDIAKGIKNKMTDSIEGKHINSGIYYYDTNNDESHIVIFRRDEWFKTLIHECMHNFNLDMDISRINFITLLGDTFNVRSTFDLRESFSEFWARLINLSFVSILSKKKMTLMEFMHVFSLNLNIEMIYSVKQANLILSQFDLDYEHIIHKRYRVTSLKRYSERTNAFVYYIIPALMIIDCDRTLNWFYNDKYDCINFEKSEREIMIYAWYIKQLSNDAHVKKIFKEVKAKKLKSLYYRMSIFESVI